MTLKDQLDAAEAKANDLQTKLTAAENEAKKHKSDAEAATTRADKAEKEAKDATAKLEAEQKAHADTKTKLDAAENAKNALEAQDKTAGAKAAETLAKNGIVSTPKGSAKDTPGNAEDPVATWEAYQNADPVTQATMRETLGDKLEAAAEAYDRAQAGK